MFTGLVEEMGTVAGIVAEGGKSQLTIQCRVAAEGVELGASISVSGCCLTVIRQAGDLLTFDAGDETLSRTNLGRLRVGDRVNLERALAFGDRLGGHLVSGHIDGVGRLLKREDDGQWSKLWFGAPAHLTCQMASKGSVTVDGVSLTLVDVAADHFSVALVPHTLAVTTLGRLAVGDEVNLETDILAKYVQRYLQATSTPAAGVEDNRGSQEGA